MAKERPLEREAFAAALNVSRETLGHFDAYLALLSRWQTRVNLVGRRTLADPWRRHFLDSGQLASLLPADARSVADLGSGAGFPGLVLAILGVPGVVLIERDQRKATFLREAARVTEASVEIVPAPAESLDARSFDVVTARALAPLPHLLKVSAPLLAPGGLCLFLKGAQVENELTQAAKEWKIKPKLFTSRADSTGIVLQLEGVAHAGRRQP